MTEPAATPYPSETMCNALRSAADAFRDKAVAAQIESPAYAAKLRRFASRLEHAAAAERNGALKAYLLDRHGDGQ